MLTRTGKSQYTEVEAAEELGVSVDRLRTLVRRHVATTEEDATNIPITTYQPSDLLLLRFLTANLGESPARVLEETPV
jgi:hypothetical protein